MLKFFLGNNKLKGRDIYTFSLPAGWTCPGAKDCLSKVDRHSGKLVQDGPEYRCFAASMEHRPSVRNARWENFDQLRACENKAQMVALILQSLPLKARLVRVHVSGDFFSPEYFLAWMAVAKRWRPETRFYAYTKSINYLVKYWRQIPSNFVLVASVGSKFDELISKHKLRSAQVVLSVTDAEQMELELDHDDSLAHSGQRSFGLLIHGMQSAGSRASSAVKALAGLGSYTSS